MENPIKKATRAKIYLAGQISGPVLTVVTAVMLVLLGAASPWLGVVAVVGSSILTLTATMARSNLGDPDNSGGSNDEAEADAPVVE